MDRRDTEQGALRRRMDDMQKALAVVHERPREPLRITSGFGREVDGAVVVAMSQKHAVVGAVQEQLQTWLQAFGFGPEECDIKEAGEGPTKRFLVSFKRLVASACRKGGHVLVSLKDGNRWNEFTVNVAGSPDGRLFLGPDKNPKQICTEVTLRRCRAAIAAEHPQARLFIDICVYIHIYIYIERERERERESGALMAGWDRTLNVEVSNGVSPPILEWEPNRIRKNGLDEATLRHSYRRA